MTANNHPINPHRRLAWAIVQAASPFTLAARGHDGLSSSTSTPSSPGTISINSQSAAQEVTARQTATFSVTAVGTGTGALSYQ